jgi:hypothetical protein
MELANEYMVHRMGIMARKGGSQVTAIPWKPHYVNTLRAAIVTGGTHSRVCRYVTYRPQDTRYAVHIARRGQLGRKIASGVGPPDEAVRHGCADYQFIHMRGVWNRPPKIPLDGGAAPGV